MFSFEKLSNPPPPTYPEYEALLADARRACPSFVDPANLYPARQVIKDRGGDWVTAVLGRLYDFGRLTMVDHYLLIEADRANIDPPLPGWIVEGRAEDARIAAERAAARERIAAREAAAWLAAQQAMAQAGVDVDQVEVHDGSRPRTRHGRSEYLRHAVPTVDLYSGARRVRTHGAGRALCESPSRAKPLGLSGRADGPVTCERCLDWAAQVRASMTASTH